MNEERESEEKGFVVIDRRGGADEEATDAEDSEVSTVGAGEPGPAPSEDARADAREALPQMDFSTLLHSFAISALYHLGIAPGPDGKPAAPDLTLAKQNIDILEVLGEKTQGNLTEEEGQLLEGILYEVRMRFVEVSQGKTD